MLENNLPRVHVPEMSNYDIAIGAYTHTGTAYITDAINMLVAHTHAPNVAMDIETLGLNEHRFTIKCVTAAWELDGRYHTILLNPSREPEHIPLLKRLVAHAGTIVFHNAMFDIPPLYKNGYISLEDISKVWDTLILARLVHTPNTVDRSLFALAMRYGLAPPGTDGLSFTVQSLKSVRVKDDWWTQGDIHMYVYRAGAMADTVLTLQLVYPLYTAALQHLSREHNPTQAVLPTDAAHALIAKLIRVHSIVLRRCAIGVPVNPDAVDLFHEKYDPIMEQGIAMLSAEGITYSNPRTLLEFLDRAGLLPSTWPRTASTGMLRATKEDLASIEYLNVPHVQTYTKVRDIERTFGYLEKVIAGAAVTGRLHPSFDVLGASASGRMSAANPPLQQFSADARAVIGGDGSALSSIDWSSIEPVLMSACANDEKYTIPNFNGEDIYSNVQKGANVPRKIAKTILLAQMYGQGTGSLSMRLGLNEREGAELVNQVKKATPKMFQFISSLSRRANRQGSITTLEGRVMATVDPHTGTNYGYKGVNYFCQGTAADIMYDTVIRLDDAGVSEHIYLWVHDEFVVDKQVADIVEREMQRAPQFLLTAAGDPEHVRLRTDTNHLDDNRWAKV